MREQRTFLRKKAGRKEEKEGGRTGRREGGREEKRTYRSSRSQSSCVRDSSIFNFSHHVLIESQLT